MARSMLREFLVSQESAEEEVKDTVTDNSGKDAASDEPTDQGGDEQGEVKDQSDGGQSDHVDTVHDPDETHTEVKVSERDVEIAENIEKSVESYKAQIEASLEDGGLTDREVVLVRCGFESLAREMGVEPESVATMEAFSAEGEELDREAATKAALESLEVTLEAVGKSVEKIREAVDAPAE